MWSDSRPALAAVLLAAILAGSCGRSDAHKAAPEPMATYTTCATPSATPGQCRVVLCTRSQCVMQTPTPAADAHHEAHPS